MPVADHPASRSWRSGSGRPPPCQENPEASGQPGACCACPMSATPRLQFCKASARSHRSGLMHTPSTISSRDTAPNRDWHSVAPSFRPTADPAAKNGSGTAGAGPSRAQTGGCRTSVGAHLVMRGVQLSYVAKLLGHKSIRVTEQDYGHLVEDHGMDTLRPPIPSFS
jgi:hypothetical protein